MKILFICRANVGRSQMAEAIFNKYSKEHIAISAGINPPKKWENQKISKAKFVVLSMDEIGCNVDKKISKRLTKSRVDESDKIIVIGEKENWPDYLTTSNKVEFWDIEDPAKGDLVIHRKVRDKIKENIKKLQSTLPNNI